MSRDRRYKIKINIDLDDLKKAVEWCKEYFGPKNRKLWGHTSIRWNWNANCPHATFYFKDKIDAVAFKLRWL